MTEPNYLNRLPSLRSLLRGPMRDVIQDEEYNMATEDEIMLPPISGNHQTPLMNPHRYNEVYGFEPSAAKTFRQGQVLSCNRAQVQPRDVGSEHQRTGDSFGHLSLQYGKEFRHRERVVAQDPGDYVHSSIFKADRERGSHVPNQLIVRERTDFGHHASHYSGYENLGPENILYFQSKYLFPHSSSYFTLPRVDQIHGARGPHPSLSQYQTGAGMPLVQNALTTSSLHRLSPFHQSRRTASGSTTLFDTTTELSTPYSQGQRSVHDQMRQPRPPPQKNGRSLHFGEIDNLDHGAIAETQLRLPIFSHAGDVPLVEPVPMRPLHWTVNAGNVTTWTKFQKIRLIDFEEQGKILSAQILGKWKMDSAEPEDKIETEILFAANISHLR
jgi:hypothetical protein